MFLSPLFSPLPLATPKANRKSQGSILPMRIELCDSQSAFDAVAFSTLFWRFEAPCDSFLYSKGCGCVTKSPSSLRKLVFSFEIRSAPRRNTISGQIGICILIVFSFFQREDNVRAVPILASGRIRRYASWQRVIRCSEADSALVRSRCIRKYLRDLRAQWSDISTSAPVYI